MYRISHGLYHLRCDGAIVCLDQADREKRQRQRRRDAQLDDEATEIDALRRVQGGVSHDLIGRRRSRTGESAAFEHAVEHFSKTTIDTSSKRSAVGLEDIRRADAKRLT